MANKPGWGGPRKNSGRKTNAERVLAAGFSAVWWTPEMQKTKWREFLEHPDKRISLEAAKYLSNRIYGCPTQAVDNKHSGELELIKRVVSDL